jgi:hypothetical protein
MPSIRDLFGAVPGAEASEADFDLEKFLAEADQIIAARPSDEPPVEPPAAQVEPTSEPIEAPPVEPSAEPVEPELPPIEPAQPTVLPPVATVDPLSELPAERRAALLALDEVMRADPSKRDAIFRTIQSVPEPVVEPLPEDVDPGSFEARLWREQQETRRTLSELNQRLQAQQMQSEQARAANDAQTAASSFASRYPQLEQADVYEIARQDGASGTAGAFVAADRDNPIAALERAFEATLYSNESFRQKVIGAPVAVVPGNQPEAVERKRKLTALSSAASPVAPGPTTRQALETRPDGRLTPDSRQQAVKEVAAGLLRQRQGY